MQQFGHCANVKASKTTTVVQVFISSIPASAGLILSYLWYKSASSSSNGDAPVFGL